MIKEIGEDTELMINNNYAKSKYENRETDADLYNFRKVNNFKATYKDFMQKVFLEDLSG